MMVVLERLKGVRVATNDQGRYRSEFISEAPMLGRIIMV